MRIIVISLPRATERRASITSQFQKLKIAFEFLDATDARAISDADYARTIDDEARRRHSYYPLTKGEVACRISHERAITLVANGNDPMAVILEDDAVLQPNFTATLAAIENLDPAFDILTLHKFMGSRRFFVPLQRLGEANQIGIIGYNHTSCLGQVISQTGARKIIEQKSPYSAPVDIALHRWWASGLVIYGLRESAVTTFDAGYSYIDAQSGTGHHRHAISYSDCKTPFRRAMRFLLTRKVDSIAKRALFPFYVMRSFINLRR
jgi:glycosyl transferase family 25